MPLQVLEGRVLDILALQDRPPQGIGSGALPKSLLLSHALSFRRSNYSDDDNGAEDSVAKDFNPDAAITRGEVKPITAI